MPGKKQMFVLDSNHTPNPYGPGSRVGDSKLLTDCTNSLAKEIFTNELCF